MAKFHTISLLSRAVYLGELVVDVDEPHVGGVGVGLQDAHDRVLHLGLGNGAKTDVGEDLEHVDNTADGADCVVVWKEQS